MKALCLALLALGSCLRAGVAPYLVDGLALQGYDAVSYVQDQKAVRGSKTYSTELDGARYLFSSQAHLDAFKKEPQRYLPAYGGWCAYAMSKGQQVEVDPQHFKVVDGRLMLFFYAFYNDTLKKWNADEKRLLSKADAEWQRLSAKARP